MTTKTIDYHVFVHSYPDRDLDSDTKRIWRILVESPLLWRIERIDEHATWVLVLFRNSDGVVENHSIALFPGVYDVIHGNEEYEIDDDS